MRFAQAQPHILTKATGSQRLKLRRAPWAGQAVRVILAALVLIALSGCLFSPPNRSGVPSAVPERWRSAHADGTQSRSQSPSLLARFPDQSDLPQQQLLPQGWVATLGDPSLTPLIRHAFAHNSNLKVRAASIVEAQARLSQINSQIYAPSGRTDFTFRTAGNRNAVGSSTSNSWVLGGSLSWSLDIWGQGLANAARAGALSEMSVAQLHGSGLSIAASVARSWYQLQAQRTQVAILERQVELWESEVARRDQRYRDGLVDLSAKAGGESSMLQARTQLSAGKRSERQLVHALQLLMGEFPGLWRDEVEPMVQEAGGLNAGANRADASANSNASPHSGASSSRIASNALPALSPLPALQTPQQVLLQRPDIRAANASLRAADWNVTSMWRGLFPQFGASGSGSYTAENIGDLITGGSSTGNLAINAILAINPWSQIAGIQNAKAAAQRAVHQWVALLQSAAGEVENALYAEAALSEQLAQAQQRYQWSQRLLQDAERTYATGITEASGLHSLQISELNGRAALIQSHLQQITNRIDLYLALGWVPLPLDDQEEMMELAGGDANSPAAARRQTESNAASQAAFGNMLDTGEQSANDSGKIEEQQATWRATYCPDCIQPAATPIATPTATPLPLNHE